MRRLRRLAERHAALAYFAVTFAISWGGLLALGGVGGMSGPTWQSDPRLPLMVVAMLAGPAAAGLLLTGLASGRSGFRQLGARLFRWRAGARWYAAALLTAPLGFLLVHSLLSLASPAFRPIVLTISDRGAFLVSSLAGAFVVGVCEELGWTGFATPTLRRRHGVLATGLIVGVPWGAWHLLTNDVWIARSYSGGLSPGAFVLLNGLSLLFGQLPAYRVLMAYVYERTGSLLVAMLMHASLSACTFVLGPEKVTGFALVGYGFALAAVWWLVVGIGWLAGHFSRAAAGPVSAIDDVSRGRRGAGAY